jgi:hypothetical protein
VNFVAGDLYILALSNCEFFENQCGDYHNYRRVCMNFCVYFSKLLFSLFGNFQFCEYQYGETQTLLRGVNELYSYFPHLLSDFGEAQCSK